MAGQTVVVSVLADTKKFSSAMKKLGDETGLSKLSSGAKKVGGAFKTAGKAIGAAGLAVGALAVKGGIERALQIENAQAKLKGLGYATQDITKIMDNALAAVKGTSFGMGEAATTAATAMAAGVAQGKDLENYLRLVGDAATIAGADMGEMGSIFNKVQANGKMMTTNLNQLQDRGIPVLQWLAEEYGVTAGEMSKMVTQGKVDSQTFRKVMEDNLGGAALESGNTTQGAFKNMMAALSRAGLALINDIFPMFKDAFSGIGKFLDGVPEKVAPIGKAVSQWITNTAVPAFQKLGDWFSENGPTIEAFTGKVIDLVQNGFGVAADVGKTVIATLQNIGGWVKNNTQWLAPLAVAVTAMVTAYMAVQKVIAIINAAKVAMAAAKVAMIAFNTAMLANPIGIIVAALAALVAGLTYFFTQTEMGKEIWDRIWTGIQATWETVSTAIMAGFDAFIAWVTPIMEQLGEAWAIIWDNIKMAWEVVGPPMIAAISTGFELIKNNIAAAMEFVWGIIQTIWAQIQNVVQTVMGVIQGIIKTITSLIKGDWEGAWQGIKQIFSSIIEGIARTAKNIFDGIVRSIGTILNGLLKNITTILNSIRDFFANSWQTVKDKALQMFTSMKDGVVERAQSLLDFVKSIPDKVLGFFTNAPSLLLDAGKKVIDGFLNGITGGFNKVKDKLGELTSFLPDWKGPAETDRTILIKSGNLVIDGFVKGLEQSYGNVHKSLAGLTGSLDVSVPTRMAQRPKNHSIGVQPSNLAVPVNRTVMADQKPSRMLTDEDIRLLAQAIREGSADGIRDGMDVSAGYMKTLVRAM